MNDETAPAYDACRAWIYNEEISGQKSRACVLLSGHYVEGAVGSVDDPRRSWHTDCPNAIAKRVPDKDQHTHKHAGVSCSVWSDWASGAHRDERIAPGSCGSDVRPPLDFSGTAFADSAEKVTPAVPRTQKINYLGDYEAQVRVGGASSTVRGPARLVAAVIRAFADAFEEESER
jgi:hypothetical protein